MKHARVSRKILTRISSTFTSRTRGQKGHAAGATHIGKGIIERDIESTIPDKSAEVILYCGGGYRSILAADMLQKMGYTNVASMTGGWRAWRETGAPTE